MEPLLHISLPNAILSVNSRQPAGRPSQPGTPAQEVSTIPLVVRATINATGAVTFTGNTLGLSRSDTAGVPGTQDSIGAFTTVNTASVYNSYPAGTTSLYTANSSAAILNLPPGSTVLYAELIWGGSYINGTVNLSAQINNPVSLTLPSGTVISVSPDSATSNNVDLGNGASAYVRSANVTSYIQLGGAGRYITGGVAGTIVISGDPTANHAGWTLGVIYQNPSLPFRNMSLRAGAVLVQSTSAPVTTTLTGFATPVSGALGGRALFSAQEGDANRAGDQALFGPNAASLAALSGPNNFANNFFASQINNDAGLIDTTGTFGSRNQTNGSPGSNISGGRQGWDITNVDISPRLVNNQASAVLTLTTSGDAYVVNANAIQVDINAPKITVTKSAGAAGAVVGDLLTYTVTVANTGTANATSAVLTDALPAGLVFAGGSVSVAGVSRPGFDIVAGVPLGTVNFGTSVTVVYQARVSSLPSPQQAANTASAAFTFQSVSGGPVLTGVVPSNTVTLPVYSPVLAISKSASQTAAVVGDTVTYTLSVSNSGNIGASVTLTDNIPSGSTYVPGSFTVSGTPVAGNPAAGIAIGTVASGQTVTARFSVLVSSLPSPPALTDQATAAYTYQVPDGRTLSGNAASNSLTLPVSVPNVSVVKSVSQSEAAVGQTLTYTAVVANNGASPLTAVTLTDALPAGSTFVAGSASLSGTPLPAADPATGIPIGTLAPGASAAAVFRVSVAAVPSSGQLNNRASAAYNSGAFSGIAQSNTVTTAVYLPVITAVKSASAASALVGGMLVYRIRIANTGNLGAEVTFSDTPPSGTTFVPGSVTVGGVARPAASPLGGIELGTVAPGADTEVAFTVSVNSLPSPAVLVNQGTAAYRYQLPGGSGPFTGSALTNTISTPVSAPNLTLTKTAGTAAVAVGENLTYTLTAANSGAALLENIILSDTLPAGTTFVTGSVLVNGTPVPGASPAAGIRLPNLAAGASAAVAFTVNVSSLPSPAVLGNRASAAFTSGSFSGSAVSPLAETPVYQPVLNLLKSAGTSPVAAGSTLSYQIRVSNTGNISASATLTDLLPPEAAFIPNSVQIGSVPLPGYDPASGIPVGPLAPGDSTAVSFLVTVNAVPPSQRLVNQASAAYTFLLPDGRRLGGTAASNTLSVPVSSPQVSVVNSISASAAVTGDVLTITSVITNTGDAAAGQLVYSDPLPPNVTFLPGTVTVNGASLPNAVPASGILIGSLAPGGAVAVSFEVRVHMPNPTLISNQSSVSFTSGVFSSSSASNVTATPIIEPQLGLVKSASAAVATVGDTIVYTVVVANTGNLEASVTLTDPLPSGTTFSANSVIVGGLPLPGASPDSGIAVGVVPAGGAVTVTFSAVITSLPTPQFLNNQASAAYTYTTPDGRPLSGSALSNTITISVSAPNVSVTKVTGSTAATVGDVITYSVIVLNNGIAAVNNLQLTDPLAPEAAFVTGSVTVAGTPVPSANPSLGIPLSSLAPGASVTVTYNVRVNAVPSGAELLNQASVAFTSGAVSATALSARIAIPVYQPVLNVVKSAGTAQATVGDTVSYTLTVSNAGNYAASATLTDTLPAGSVFIPNSVLVNGLPLPQADPASGIAVGSIAPGSIVTVTFSVEITSLPVPQLLVNQGLASYTYTLPDGRTASGASSSNSVSLPVSSPNVSVVKTTGTSATTVGDTLIYSVIVTNNGIAAVNNLVLSDVVAAVTTFIPGSVTVAGEPRPSASPSAGIPLGSLTPGSSVTVAFSVSVTALPPDGTLTNQSSVSFTSGTLSSVTFSNTVSLPVYRPILSAAKSSSLSIATVGDTVVYTVNVANTGNYPASATLTDTIPAGAVLVPNSVLVGGIPVPGADPAAGIPLGSIAPGASLPVIFSAVIQTLPPSQQLANQAAVSLSYTLPDGRPFTASLASNTVLISVSSPNVTVVKSTAVADVVVGDTFTFGIAVTNNGIAAVDNVVLSDPIPAGTILVPGSVTVGGTARPSANPAAGISLGTLAPGATVQVAFNLNVTSLPSPAVLNNQASVSFTSGAFSGASYSNTVAVPVYQPILTLAKTASVANVTIGNTLTYSILITNGGNLSADVTLFDSIPAGATFVPNSVLLNNVPLPGVDPSGGIAVGPVAPGSPATVTLTVLAADSSPAPQQLVNQASSSYTYSPPDGRLLNGSAVSNSLAVPLSSPDVTVVKNTSVSNAVVGDIITYTIAVTNNGTAEVSNAVLIDPIPAGSQFVGGSVAVNGTPMPGESPATGVPIGTIAAGASVNVTFQVQVVAL